MFLVEDGSGRFDRLVDGHGRRELVVIAEGHRTERREGVRASETSAAAPLEVRLAPDAGH